MQQCICYMTSSYLCRGYVFTRFCLCVRLCAKYLKKNQLDFGGDPNSFVDPRSFSRFLYRYQISINQNFFEVAEVVDYC